MTPLNTNTEGYSFQIPVQYRDTRKKSPDRLSRLSSETLENQNFSSKESKVKNKVSKIHEPKETRVALASEDFHYWNVTYDHHGETDKAKLLLNWLHYDSGAKLITTYEEFTELVTKLNSGENSIPKYDITETPSKVDFEKSMFKYARYAKVSYEPSKETRVALASEEFHACNVTYDHHGETNKAKLLLEWLYRFSGAKLITTYEEFTELVTKLNSGEDDIPKYDINETPPKVDFEKSMFKYALKAGISYEASKEARIALASESFNYWSVKVDQHREMDLSKFLLEWLYRYSGVTLITTYEEFTELVTKLNSGEDNIPKYDINETPSKVDFEKSMFKYARSAKVSYEPSKETRIALASESFNYWNVTYDQRGETNKAILLLEWLYCDYGAKLITTYEEFTELVTKLNSGEDNIPKYDINETPSKVEFEKSMIIYARNAGISYEAYKEGRIALASEDFHYWDVKHDQRGETNKAKSLLEWLYSYSGAKLITTYEEFTELVTKLNSGEDNIPKYDINETPSKVEFEKTMIKYARSAGISYEASKEARIALASEDFHYWNVTYDQRGETNKDKFLLEWLHCYSGAKLISTYEEFTELVSKLNSGEDNIPKYDINETPSKVEFEKSMIKYARSTGISYEASKEARIALASEDFHYWNITYDQRGETNKAKLLLEWLYCDYGAKLITTYEEFTELVTKLNSGEDNIPKYDINEIPSKEDFEKAIENYSKKIKNRQS